MVPVFPSIFTISFGGLVMIGLTIFVSLFSIYLVLKKCTVYDYGIIAPVVLIIFPTIFIIMYIAETSPEISAYLRETELRRRAIQMITQQKINEKENLIENMICSLNESIKMNDEQLPSTFL